MAAKRNKIKNNVNINCLKINTYYVKRYFSVKIIYKVKKISYNLNNLL